MSEPLINSPESAFASLPHVPLSDIRNFFLASELRISGAVDFESALPLYHEHAKRYEQWIHNEKHGEMEYLRRGLERKLDPRLVFPELKSVWVVAMPYTPHPIEKQGLRYARYLNGADYHDVLSEKLTAAMTHAQKENPSLKYKVCVDTSAVLERTWATIAGLGWIGKNTLLIHPEHGSYIFLGVVFTNATTGEKPNLLKDYCGSCTRCIEVCPTKALQSHDLDSRICISYLTLEKRGPWQKDFDTKGFLAGCDLCQQICPFNTKAVKHRSVPVVESHLELSEEILLLESEVDYKKRVKGTALSRVKFSDFQRNLASAIRKRSPDFR